MLTDAQSERYLRHILLKEVGAQGQLKLSAARVLIVGAGGLGSPLIQYLAAAGVGTLGIADDDVVALSNLQRQTIFSAADIGMRKTDAAAAFASRLNEDVRIVRHDFRIDDESALSVAGNYDLIVEGVDNFRTRFALNKACMTLRKPLVSAAIGRFEGQISVFKPYADRSLPCYRCWTPEAPPAGALNCAEEGVLGPVAGVIGSLAALEALKELLGIGSPLAGRILIYNGLTTEFRTVVLKADPECPDCSDLRESA